VSVINDCAAPEFWVMEKWGEENRGIANKNMATRFYHSGRLRRRNLQRHQIRAMQ